MKQVIAMHGWSGDGGSWQAWERHFSRHGWSWCSGERGYGDRTPTMPFWQTSEPGESQPCRAVIAHSLGPHLIGTDVLTQATEVVLLASFGRFVPEGPQGRALRTGLRGMREAIGGAGETAMLRTFLRRAAQPGNADGLPHGPVQKGLSAQGRERLANDLDQLIATCGLPKGLPSSARVLVVDAEEDAIVAPAARRDQLLALERHLEQPPEHWQLCKAGHALLVPDLLKRVQQWLDHASPGPA